jgi:hypothetical protein
MASKSLRRVILASAAVIALVVSGFAVNANTWSSDATLNDLLTQREQGAAKLAAMEVPPIEQVGANEYKRLASENAAQGYKVKQLDLAIANRANELNLTTPDGDKRDLEDKLVAARAAFGDAKREWYQSPDSPEKVKFLKKIDIMTAILDGVDADYKAGRKNHKDLLKDMEALLKVQ